MNLSYQPLELVDFSGGLTDNPFTAPLNKATVQDNLLVDPNRKLIQRPGSVVSAKGSKAILFGQSRINKILAQDIENIYYVGSANRMFYPGSTACIELLGIGGVPAFNAGTNATFSSFAEWNKHFFGVNSDFAKPIKIYKDGAGVPQVRTAGLPKMSSTPVVTPVGGAGSFIWYFIYKFTYNIGGTTFFDLSTPIFVQNTAATAPSGGTPAAISGIPALVNAGGTSYELTAITKQIYRTTDGGKAAFLVGEIANAVTSFSDTTTDAAAQLNEPLYTTGPNGTDGTLAYDEPPLAKYMHVMDGTAYYLYTKEAGIPYPFRVRQSTPGDPDSVPVDFFTDVRDDGQGISSYKGRIIVFGTTKVYRLDGAFDELGRGGSVAEEISKVTGCISHDSIVQTEVGVFFAGNSGFYWTDGYDVIKISDDNNTTYKTIISELVDTRSIQGTYDSLNLKALWTVKKQNTSGDNDTLFVLDLRFFQPSQRDASFSTWSNEGVFNPTAIAIYKKNLLRGDIYGYLYEHDPELGTDPFTDPDAAIEDWNTKTIIWDWESVHLNFGMPAIRKWVSQLLITCRNLSNMSIQPYSINDDSSEEKALKEIRFRDNLVWGDPEATWGDPLLQWLFQGLIEQRRRFPAGGLRCSYKAVRLTNAYVIISNSDVYGTVTVDRVTKVATLDMGTIPWGADLAGYDLVLKPHGPVDPGYALSLPIKSRDSDTQITLSDPTDLMNTLYPVSGGYNFTAVQWVMKGIPKNEIGNLMGIVIYYAPLTPTQRTYYGTQSETGANTT